MEQSFVLKYPGEREFRVAICDLLGAPVDAIVNPANSGLSHGGGLAAEISEQAGPKLDEACRLLVKMYGRVPVAGAVATPAYDLPFKGIIHAIGPRFGEGDEQGKIERTILNCLKLAEQRGWRSVAFPAISTGLFAVPVGVCAKAFKRAVSSALSSLERVRIVQLCLCADNYGLFQKALRQQG